jgi:RimJ/RimL family protein N-acetyltransferase
MTSDVDELVTARLRLRALIPSDIDDLAALHSDPKVMLGRTGVAIPEGHSETEAWLGRALALPHGEGLGMFRVEYKTTGDFIGRGGIRPEAGTGQNEIVFALRSDHWGSGLGTELGQALWEHAARSGLTALVGDVLRGNVASQRILKGLGMAFIREQPYVDGTIVLRFEGRPAAA